MEEYDNKKMSYILIVKRMEDNDNKKMVIYFGNKKNGRIWQ